jgi:hypothetical protein
MKQCLKDISEIRLGYLPRKETSGIPNARIILPKDIDEFNCLNLGNTNDIHLDTPEKHSIGDGEVLLLSRGRYAATVFHCVDDAKYVASSLYFRLIVKSRTAFPEYVALYLNSEEGKRKLEKLSSSFMIRAINKAQIEDFEIPIIPLDTQKKLVELYTESQKWNALRLKQTQLWENLINKIISKNTGK